MNYKDTVIHSLMYYQSLFQCRLDVDNQLFAVIGNGYEWKDGELVCLDRNESFDKNEAIKRIIATQIRVSLDNVDLYNLYPNKKEYLDDKANKILNYINMIQNTESRYNIYEHIPDEIELRTKEQWKIYPICDSSKLVDFPDNIKPAWKEAMLHFIDWCLNHAEYLNNDKDNKYLIESKNRLESL